VLRQQRKRAVIAADDWRRGRKRLPRRGHGEEIQGCWSVRRRGGETRYRLSLTFRPGVQWNKLPGPALVGLHPAHAVTSRIFRPQAFQFPIRTSASAFPSCLPNRIDYSWWRRERRHSRSRLRCCVKRRAEDFQTRGWHVRSQRLRFRCEWRGSSTAERCARHCWGRGFDEHMGCTSRAEGGTATNLMRPVQACSHCKMIERAGWRISADTIVLCDAAARQRCGELSCRLRDSRCLSDK